MATYATEVKLYNTTKERDMYDAMALLYSIIKTTEHLEKAFVADAITKEEYSEELGKLLIQYRNARSLTKEFVPDVNKFAQEYRLDAKLALDRLEKGVVEVPGGGAQHKIIAETVQFFITAMDSLKLNMVAVDQIQPLLTDLYESLCKINSLPRTFEGKMKVQQWIQTLQTMKASDELNPDQIRQLLFDLETSYTAFHRSLTSA